MQQSYLNESGKVRIATDLTQLRNSEPYQQIRDALDRRFNPLSGAVDWQVIQQACHKLLTTIGVDLQIAIYYTIAAFKESGLVGLAEGLEIQACVLNTVQSSVQQRLQDKRTANLYSWMNQRILTDLTRLRPSQQQLPELYRCEAALTQMNQKLQQLQPEPYPDLESLALILFEQIDRLEHNAPTSLTQATQTVPERNKQRPLYLLLLGCLIGSLGFWLYQYLNLPHKTALEPFTVTQIAPRPLELSQLQQMIQQMTPQQWQAIQPQLMVLYQTTIEQKLNTYQANTLQGIKELLEQLKLIAPHNSKTQVLEKQLIQRATQRDELYRTQLNRFLNSRTLIANLQNDITQQQWGNARQNAVDLESYALSLSPLLGRLLYIERLLQQQQLAPAQRELHTLDLMLESLALKQQQLQQQLNLMNE